MPKIHTYANDSVVDVNDRLLGSNSEGSITKNFPIQSVVDLLNASSGDENFIEVTTPTPETTLPVITADTVKHVIYNNCGDDHIINAGVGNTVDTAASFTSLDQDVVVLRPILSTGNWVIE